MFGFIKTIFLTGLAFLSSLVSATPLSCILICILMNNQAFKIKPEIINVNSNFILLVLKQVNAEEAVTVLMIHIQKYVFLMP